MLDLTILRIIQNKFVLTKNMATSMVCHARDHKISANLDPPLSNQTDIIKNFRDAKCSSWLVKNQLSSTTNCTKILTPTSETANATQRKINLYYTWLVPCLHDLHTLGLTWSAPCRGWGGWVNEIKRWSTISRKRGILSGFACCMEKDSSIGNFLSNSYWYWSGGTWFTCFFHLSMIPEYLLSVKILN